MASTSIVWAFLAFLFNRTDKGTQKSAIKRETRDDTSIKEEEDEDEDKGFWSLKFPTTQNQDSQDVKPETSSTTSEAEDAEGDAQEDVGGYIGHGGMGTGLESAEDRGVQRRRSRVFQGRDSEE